MLRSLALGPAVLAFILPVPAAAESFGADVGASQRFQSDFLNHGGTPESYTLFDLDRGNGKTSWEISGTDSAIFNSGGAQPISVPVSADYFASADLSTGKLKVLAQNPWIDGSYTVDGVTYPTYYTGHARSSASIFDTLTFDWAPEQIGTYQPFSLRAKLDGIISLAPVPSSSGGTVALTLIATRREGTSILPVGGIYRLGYSNGEYFEYSQPIFGDAPVHHGDNIYGFDFFVQASDDPITVFALLSADANGATVDYSHTATLSLTVPVGVTYTSDSGVFLSGGPISAIPEPANWALMIGGFVLAGGALRRRPAVCAVRFA